jgi:hypothetical protein
MDQHAIDHDRRCGQSERDLVIPGVRHRHDEKGHHKVRDHAEPDTAAPPLSSQRWYAAAQKHVGCDNARRDKEVRKDTEDGGGKAAGPCRITPNEPCSYAVKNCRWLRTAADAEKNERIEQVQCSNGKTAKQDRASN